MRVGTGQEETVDASRPVPDPEGPPSEVWSPTRTGELVGGKYRISRYLAEGGMGVVYEAQHAIVKRRFAVKFLRPDFARRRENLGRFQREAEAAGGLESEHIASVIDFGITAQGIPYLVMEYLVGESLATLLKREGRLPFQRAADLCVQACHGAETAHTAGIIHRDLKPQNVFLCRRDDGTDLLKLLDFGIAKLEPLKHDQVSTQTGAVLGTPAYMSPEQARGERAVDLRTDVYSLGAILFEMVSGQLPHPGDSPNAALYHISTQPALALAQVAPDLPHDLAVIVDRAVASDPGVRPASAKAFAAALLPFAKREVWQEPPHPTPPASAEPVVPTRKPGRAAATTPRHGRRPVPTLVTVLTATALVAGAGVVALRWPRTAMAPQRRLAPTSSEEPKPAPVPLPTPRGAAPEVVSASPSPTPATVPDAAVRAPAKTLAARPAAPGSRPTPRRDGRAAAAAVQNVRGEGAANPGTSPTASKTAFPRAAFDPDNPYGSP